MLRWVIFRPKTNDSVIYDGTKVFRVTVMVKIGAYFVVRRHCVMDHFRQVQNGMQMHPPHDPKAIGVEAIVTAIFDFYFDNEARVNHAADVRVARTENPVESVCPKSPVYLGQSGLGARWGYFPIQN